VADDRSAPERTADERTTLTQFLDYYRETLLVKADGLTERQARFSPVPSGTCLLGLMRHAAEVERGWFRQILGGEDIGDLYVTDDDPDGDFHFGPNDTLADAAAAYQGEIEEARRIVAGLDSLDALTPRQPRRGPTNARWVLVHMIEETARHAGHADMVRELIDGSTGD
jgi:hypothetical protein